MNMQAHVFLAARLNLADVDSSPARFKREMRHLIRELQKLQMTTKDGWSVSLKKQKNEIELEVLASPNAAARMKTQRERRANAKALTGELGEVLLVGGA